MPTYSYRCDACGHQFEQVQRITEAPTKECPECHELQTRRMINSANFILKGSGWYSDLYSGGSNKKVGASAESKGATTAKPAESCAAACPAAPACPAAAPAPSTPSTGSN